MSEERKTQSEFIQKLSNQKIVLGILSLTMCLALIAVCSFSSFVIDPSRIGTNEFLTDELIIIAIVIMSMVSAMFIGQAGNAQDSRSRISKARKAFTDSYLKLKARNVNDFKQWVKKVLEKEDIQSIKERKLRKIDVDDLTIFDLTDTQIRSLTEPQKIEDRFYKSLDKEKIEEIIKIKNEKIKLDFVSPEYYLSASTLSDSRTISERASNEGKKKGSFFLLRLGGKLVITIVTGMIFGSLVRDLVGDGDTMEAVAKFLTRLWSMVSSAFMGYLLGVQINDIDAEYVEMRVSVHERFLSDNTFKPLEQQEEAKQQYIERVKKEQVLLEFRGKENES